ncbi:putative phosphatidylinositol 3 kinase [Leptomonas seymouri]|uniref:Serine/threonine-protein kinase TOR n=1 Tax=Leptomonas seymouri TaxID=5684 RepID=A0A0N1HXC9_LEPSE|nr:putative phosphatidylinositol 3 kinase [Leptomonas seymouri]|eukprot:KPI87065.1 putative phosphatidylinositol 3 kinase [Leptomonas seymouri]
MDVKGSANGSSNRHPLIGQLRPIFQELETATPQTLSSTILKLEYVIEEEKDALFHRNSIKSYTANSRVFPNWLNAQLFHLFENSQTQMTGVQVLRALLPVEYVELNEMTKLFSELLVRCVLETSDYQTGLAAGEVWGLLLNNGSSVVEGIISNCLQFSLALLMRGGHDEGFLNELAADSRRTDSAGDRPETASSALPDTDPARRDDVSYVTDEELFPHATKLAGCIFIQQLVRRVPSTIVPHVNSILECLRRAVLDTNKLVRVSAGDALFHTLVISYRSTDPSLYNKWQTIFLEDAERSTVYGSDIALHGCLLAFNAVLSATSSREEDGRSVGFSSQGRAHILQLWTFVNNNLVHTSHNTDARKEILNSLPLLAQYDSTTFKEISVKEVRALAAVVFGETDGPDERATVFLVFAQLFTVLPSLVVPFLDYMMKYIEASLTPRPNRDRCPEAVTCFATLSGVEPNAVRPFLRHLLGPLFAGSVTEHFARDVAKICTAFPELRSTCLSRVLEATKEQLFRMRSRPRCTRATGETDHSAIVRNLSSLGSLDFTGYSTLQFLCDAVIRYVSDPHEEVRRSAIDLCFKLALSGCTQSPCERTDVGVVIHRGREHMGLINTVIKKLVSAAVADTESDIRLHTLEHFTKEYDYTLALQEICTALFPALHDNHQNRIAAVRLLGRLSSRNPSCILPMLRRVMVQCIADIRLFQVPKRREQAAAVLSAVVEAAPAMVRPYISSLLQDCVQRLQEENQQVPVLTALLSLVGKLARYAEGDDVAVVAAIRPCVIRHILDSSSIQKKLEAIRALGDIIRTTKDVDVYETNPELLRVLLSALHGGFKETWPVRLDVLKLMGIIGAVDPVRAKEITRHLRDSGLSSGATAARASLQLLSSRGEEAIVQNVVKNVLTVLQLPSLSDDQCLCAVQVIANTLSLKEASNGCLTPMYREIIQTVLQQITLQAKIRENLLGVMTRIVYLYGQYIRPYLDELIATCISFLMSTERGVLVEVLCLLSELRRSLREEFRPSLSLVLPPLIQAVQADAAHAGEPVFAFLVEMGHLLDDYLHNAVPCVCEVASNPAYPMPCRAAAVDAIRHFARRLPRLVFHASRCVHCLCRVLKEMEDVALDVPQQPVTGPSGRIGSGTGSSHPSYPNAAAMAGASFAIDFNSANAAVVADARTFVAVALDAVRNVARNLGSDFEKYTSMVFPLLDAYGEDGKDVKSFVLSTLRSGGRVVAPDNSQAEEEEAAARYRVNTQQLAQRRKAALADNFAQLRSILVARDRETEEEWSLWLKQLAVELLRSSPSNAHGFAFALAQLHEPFARNMLHSAFAVCYAEMEPRTKEVVRSLLGVVLRSERVPSEVLQELLNLSEYMERLEMRFNPKEGSHSAYAGLLFDLKTLMGSSERCNLYAKALHYVEIQFYEATYEYERSVMRGQVHPLPPEDWMKLLQLCEKSIYLCNLLGLRESAEGMLKYIQHNFSFLTSKPPSELPRMMDAQLFEKLQWWSQSLRAYEKGLQAEPNKFSNMAGLMRSLDNLGDYGRLLESWKLFFPRINRKEASELAPYGAHAAWLLRRWDDMETITAYMSDDGYVGTTAIFYRAVLATHKRQFHGAVPIIQTCRKRLDSTLSALVAESYDRAYGLFVGIQQLSELEEFAFVANNPQGLNHWQELWEKRLAAMAYEGWPGTLADHTLVIPPSQELDMWLRFVTLSRVHGRERTSRDILFDLLGEQTIGAALEQDKLPQPTIALAAFQHMYEMQEREKAVEMLDTYLKKMERVSAAVASSATSPVRPHSSQASLAMCHSKLASWLFTLAKKRHNLDTDYRNYIRHHLEQATSLDSTNGSIWHTWARFNHDLVSHRWRTTAAAADLRREEHVSHIVAAMDGYVRSVCFSQELEDVLGFLSLWFSHASLQQVQSNTALHAQILQVSPTVWLKVIPQIIARLHSRDSVVSESVFHLLTIVAKAHPQALLYSLNVTLNSSVQGPDNNTTEQMERKQAAQRLLGRIKEMHHQGRAMVKDAALVCQELVRCAMLWTELWFDELERAWFQWGRDKNAHNVFQSLQPLLEQLSHPDTLAESHFVAEFGELLSGTCEYVEKAATTGNNVYMEEAWNRFKTAVKRMDEQISGMASLALQLVSPRLTQSGKELSLVVPGQYSESGAYPCIASFQNTLKVMNSKQHPRRLYINGTDGVLYKFLLKGHEDLRLDERVMQLLAFVNTLLEKHSAIQRRDCMIQVFSVTPLSENAGLVGWVDNCDTLHQLIKDYRVHSKYLSIEVNLMLSFNVDLDRLQVIQHVEPFEFALEQTEGTDLANSLWMRAPSAESWLDRRITFVCSLATMSMVGHILGLGDRHPSNLMVHSFSGRVVHIDFGDCFDVAQNRSAFPEKVPFRLTRMLVKAMEMGGIDGLFRHGCITVMGVLREEGSSILALLEAFVHDPLVSWWRDESEDGATATVKVSIPPSSSMVSTGTAAPAGGHYSQCSAYAAIGGSFHKSRSAFASRTPVSRQYRSRGSRSLRAPPASVALSTPAAIQAGASVKSSDAVSNMSVKQSSEAKKVVNRIREKLEGREFASRQAMLGRTTRAIGGGLDSTKEDALEEDLLSVAESDAAVPAGSVDDGLSVQAQVSRLILEATSNENLCVHFQGWCPFW